VVVELPAARRAQDFSVQVRGLASGVTPQVADLRCDGAPLAPDSASAWRVQGWSCVRLSWTVALKEAPEGGVDLRAREGFFDPGAPSGCSARPRRCCGRSATPARRAVEFVGRGPVHGSSPVGRRRGGRAGR